MRDDSATTQYTPNFQEEYNLAYSGIDSLVFNIDHLGFKEWANQNMDHFDLSESQTMYQKDTTTNNALGKFKDEMSGLIMTGFIILNEKFYTIYTEPRRRHQEQ